MTFNELLLHSHSHRNDTLRSSVSIMHVKNTMCRGRWRERVAQWLWKNMNVKWPDERRQLRCRRGNGVSGGNGVDWKHIRLDYLPNRRPVGVLLAGCGQIFGHQNKLLSACVTPSVSLAQSCGISTDAPCLRSVCPVLFHPASASISCPFIQLLVFICASYHLNFSHLLPGFTCIDKFDGWSLGFLLSRHLM